MLDDGDDPLAGSQMFQRRDLQSMLARDEDSAIRHIPARQQREPGAPAPWNPDSTISGRPEDPELARAMADLKRQAATNTAPPPPLPPSPPARAHAKGCAVIPCRVPAGRAPGRHCTPTRATPTREALPVASRCHRGRWLWVGPWHARAGCGHLLLVSVGSRGRLYSSANGRGGGGSAYGGGSAEGRSRASGQTQAPKEYPQGFDLFDSCEVCEACQGARQARTCSASNG